MLKKLQFKAESLMFTVLNSTTVNIFLKVTYIALSVANYCYPCKALDVLVTLVGSIC